jgi:phosphatidylglycerol:prolipoprotein diacylglycerol transferase
LPARLWWQLAAAATAAGLVGARLWSLVHAGGRGGLVWYGGVAAGALAVWVVTTLRRVRWLDAADAIAPALAAGLAIGRVGCHLAGDGDWGPPTTLPWGVRYAAGVASWPFPPGVYVHPSALYEAAASAVLCMALRGRAVAFWWWCVGAGTVRFLVELVRVEPVIACGLTEAQALGVLLVAVGLVGVSGRP